MAFCRKPNKKTNGKKAELSASFSGSAPIQLIYKQNKSNSC
jgi:hypothetical protein